MRVMRAGSENIIYQIAYKKLAYIVDNGYRKTLKLSTYA